MVCSVSSLIRILPSFLVAQKLGCGASVLLIKHGASQPEAIVESTSHILVVGLCQTIILEGIQHWINATMIRVVGNEKDVPTRAMWMEERIRIHNVYQLLFLHNELSNLSLASGLIGIKPIWSVVRVECALVDLATDLLHVGEALGSLCCSVASVL